MRGVKERRGGGGHSSVVRGVKERRGGETGES